MAHVHAVPVHAVPMVEAQIEEASQMLAQALHEDPFQKYVLPEEAERAALLPALFAANLCFGTLFGEAWTTEGTLEGVAVWQPPGCDVTPERAVQSGFSRLPALLGEPAFGRLGHLLDYLESSHRRDVPPEHWYLMVVGVAPEHQRQGIGSALMRHVFTRVDQAGLPCYLDTAQPQNVPFYQHLGFEVVADSIEPASGLRLWTFRREPQQALHYSQRD